MAALPSPTQVAGKHSAIYESYYNLVDPNGVGTIGALEAARFLKRSGLSDVVLSRIWDLSDPGGRGCLDKAGLFIALKLVSVAQQGRDINIENVLLDIPPPKMGDLPLPKPAKPPLPTISSVPPTAGVDWTIKPNEREKYDKLFDSLNPSNGLIPGNKVKGVLMDSKLPMETLGKIWDLADQDKDGMLDRHEFIVAMHLVYKALEKHAIPNTLPVELLPPTKRKGSSATGTPLIAARGLDGMRPVSVLSPPSGVPPRPQQAPPRPAPVAVPQPTVPVVSPWVVTPEERAKYEPMFVKSDVDRDGFVSGLEIKDVFLQSGVPQPVLAHIWALCDIKQSGKLNNEQFALAMWLVGRCLKGIEPPAALTPEMVPPSFRTIKPDGIVENNNTTYSNPELDMISKDLEELSKEKIALEADIQQKESDIKIKNSEIKSLQIELDTLAATLKQLENQKGEAQKRLNDLRAQVDKLRTQAAEQAEAVASQEAELNSRKQQLESLKQDEQRLEQQKNENAKKLENLTSNLQETQLTISQVKAMITQLQEQTRQMNDAISMCDSAIDSNDPNLVPDTSLRIVPDFRENEYKKLGLTNGHVKQNGFKEDPFIKQNGPISLNSGFQDDPFKSDPFKSNNNVFESTKDPFTSGFTNENNNGFKSDPFDSFNVKSEKNDPFGAFNEEIKEESKPEESKDPFGCDPFAVLHAPTRDGGPPPRPTSPSPALPPKKSKQPPPRPAPPRPAPPSKTMQNDPFGAPDPFSSGSSGGFTDFADFDSKFSGVSSTNLTNSTNKKISETAIKTLDFTDDPFRDYRYEDPFDITFDDEPDDGGRGDNSAGSLETLKSNTSNLEMRTSSNLNLKTSSSSLETSDIQWKTNVLNNEKTTPTWKLNSFNLKSDANFEKSSIWSANAPKQETTTTKLNNTDSTEWKTDFLNPSNFETNTSSMPDINKFNDKFDPFGLESSFAIGNDKKETQFDPFGLESGRQSVPIPSVFDRFPNKSGRASAPLNPSLKLNEDEQLAWAARESLKLEEMRKQKRIQEEVDLELAIALSKAENQHGKK